MRLLAVALLWLLPALFPPAALAGDAGQGPLLLVDQGHGQPFTIDGEGPLQLTGLAGIFREGGFRVASVAGPLTPESLDGASALVLSGPFQPLSVAERATVAGFLEQGGAVAIMLHVGPPAARLLEALGVTVANGVIRDPAGAVGKNPLDFLATRLEPHPLTAGVERIAAYGCWALKARTPELRELARTSPSAWIDLDGDRRLGEGDAVQSFALVVAGRKGSGKLAVFGDDAIFQNRFLVGENRVLAANLARWLLP